MPPACPCLDLNVQQVFTWTSFLFGSRSDEQGCFLVTKSYTSFSDQNGVTLTTDGVCTACCTLIRGAFNAAQLGVLSIYYWYYTPFLYSVSWNKLHFNWYFTGSECFSYWDRNDHTPPGATSPCHFIFLITFIFYSLSTHSLAPKNELQIYFKEWITKLSFCYSH